MNTNLKLRGTTEVLGKEIPNIEGGFGKNEKAMLGQLLGIKIPSMRYCSS